MRKGIFSTEKKAMVFVYEELFILLLVVIQLYKVLSIKITNDGINFFTGPVLIQNYLWFFAAILVLIVAYFGIARKDKLVMKLHANFSKIIFGAGKEKVFGVDKEVGVLLFVEFLFAVMLAVAIYVYLDPTVDIVPWPWNYITFFIVLIVGLYFFSKTKSFRETVYGESRLKKISPAKRLFPTRRITNKKTGSIRIAGKKKQAWKKHKTKHRKRLNKKKK
jgi:hypothetical protein